MATKKLKRYQPDIQALALDCDAIHEVNGRIEYELSHLSKRELGAVVASLNRAIRTLTKIKATVEVRRG